MPGIDLDGRSALITGGGQGLGAAVATALHAAGAAIAVTYWPDPEGVNRSRAEALAAGLGERALAVPGDVRSPEAMAAAMQAVTARFGGLDILVNNAGIVRDRSFKKMSPLEWQQVIDTNLTGVFTACKAAEPVMREGGRIVNVSSISAALGFFGQANYAAAKAGVQGLTRVLARELARRRITVNTVAPGLVLTEMGLTIPEAERERMLANVPLGRFGEPEDIAGAILFLCSGLAGYVTGQTLHVNGGWHPT
ncbi:MAG: 3-oxoacyl-ACP reductase FabG [Planctomycetes bacterium]|nr:3-oxoacyl-ACP reductase FabG [Planctomycetota bacterium]